jgi:hypothetical protein
MATVITATDVVTDFGEFYQDAGQGEGNIHQLLREEFGTKNAFTVVDTEDTVLRESNTNFQEVLQAFQKTFTPKGGVEFTPKSIPLYNVKVDELFYPDDLKNKWLSFLTSNSLDRTTWPFVRWFIEKYVMGQIMADLENSAIYKGVYVAPTTGVAGSAVNAMNGVKKIINDAVAAADITVLTTGAPSATNTTWCTQIETFAAQIPELYWNTEMELNMSRGLALRYKQGRRTKYNANYAQAKEMLAVQDFENITATGRASMVSENKIWMSPKANNILALKGGNNMNILEVEKVDRQVKVYTDFWVGVGFIDDRLVWTNDQNLV